MNVESRNIKVTQRPLNISKLGESCISLIREDAEAKGLKISLSCDAEMPKLLLDKVLLKQIIMILLFNSLKYTLNGYISLIFTKKENKLYIIESDSGIGIDSNILSNIFDPFSQTAQKQVCLETGMGLNLYLCRKLLLLMDGTIYANSIKEKSTSFVIALPFVSSGIVSAPRPSHLTTEVTVDKTQISKAVSEERVPGVPQHFCSFTQRKMAVLIVDDNVTNVVVLSNYMKKLCIDYDCVYNGEKAVEAALSKVYDIIFMDINMPVMNGISATKLIRQHNNENGRPRQMIYAVTAQQEFYTEKEMLSASFDDVYQKPMSIKLVKKIIDEFKTTHELLGFQ